MPEKLILPPDKDSYTVERDTGVIGSRLDGGVSRQRLDIDNPGVIVSVQWTCNPNDYKYLNAFYNLHTQKGSAPFLIDLLLNDNEPEEHEARIIENSFKLTSHTGLRYVVSATLEAVPINDPEADAIFITAYETGSIEQLDDYFLALQQLANYDIDVT